MIRFILLALFMLTSSTCLAENLPVPEPVHPELIGRIYVNSRYGTLDKRAKKEIDNLVGMLRTKGTNKIIRIEGAYNIADNKRDNVEKSLYLAKEVERYLRQKHNLKLNICIATGEGVPAKDQKVSVGILAYPDEFVEQKI